MIPHRADHLDLCAGSLLGALSDADRRELEAHLAEGCPVCEAELARLSASVELLAASAPPRRAPAVLRARVLGTVGAEMAAARTAGSSRAPLPLPTRPRVSRAAWAWAVAAALLAVAGVVQWRAILRIDGQLAAERDARARLERELKDEQAWAGLGTQPGVVQVALAPTPAGAHELAARVTYDPATRRALIVCDHFTAPTGHDYQLWSIGKTGPMSLGVVHADASGRAVIRVPDAGDPAGLGAFAVSLEQAGGAPTPNAPAGPVVMVGKLGG